MNMDSFVTDTARRQCEFPVTTEYAFFGHAGVCPLPQVAVDAMAEYSQRSARDGQNTPWTNERISEARQAAAELIGAEPGEISLLGPTSLGLSLVANGVSWRSGDEVAYYTEDYPANVYPWTGLTGLGVKAVPLEPEHPGAITWPVVEAALTPRTRLVALATCHFLSGYRIDAAAIGAKLQERGILFCLDAIQTLGAFPLDVRHADFLSADSHKWMLGPCGAGILYVAHDRAKDLRPTLRGAWNIESPGFIAQERVAFEPGGRRYEPGMLNWPGIVGMEASLRMLLALGIEAVAERILFLRHALLERIRPMGYRLYIEELDAASDDTTRSGIVTVHRPGTDMAALAKRLEQAGIVVSLRQNRAGEMFIRFAPHFYNTEEELDRAAEVLSE